MTDLEDIGDGNGVLGGLALGADDGDGRPGHDRGLPVVSSSLWLSQSASIRKARDVCAKASLSKMRKLLRST